MLNSPVATIDRLSFAASEIAEWPRLGQADWMGVSGLPMRSAAAHVAFVDAGLADGETLVAGLRADTVVYVLDPGGNALNQMTQVLAGYRDLASVQIFSHGSDGALQLGSSSLNSANLLDYAGMLQSWAEALSVDGDILLYGCNVAADAIGQSFVNQLASLTGADVAASSDLTGSSALGGDWDLEFSTGQIEASEFLSDWAQAAYQNVLATYTVTNTSDSGPGSLRDAIAQANTAAGADTINFSVSGTITLGSQLNLTDTALTTINGANTVTISGNNAICVFQVNAGATAELNGLRITGGNATTGFIDGGGIFNQGTVTVNNSTFSGNAARYGGAIVNYDGTLTVNNSTFSGNSASAGGGAIGNTSIVGTALLIVTNSTFSGNSTTGDGGAINQDALNGDGTASLTVNNSTFSGNSAGGSGGGIENFLGALTVNSSTFSGNSAGRSGGGIANFFGPTVRLTNSLVAGNSAPKGREVSGLDSGSNGNNNLIGYSGDSGIEGNFFPFFYTTPNVGLSQILETTLANNGGPTQTLALVAGSPAINAGNTTLTTDQRGIARPQGAADDIGAFELVPPPNSPPVARNDSFTTNEDTALTGNVITNTTPNGADSDPDNNPLTVATVNGIAANVGTAISLTNGTLLLNGNGSFTYTPTANANGSDSFTYTLSDGTATSNTAAVSFTLNPVNDAPVVANPLGNQSSPEDTAVNFTIPANTFSDVDNPTLSLSATLGDNSPLPAWLSFNAATRTFSGTPPANFNGSLALKVTATDAGNLSASSTFDLVIIAVNDAPVVNLTSPTQSIANTNSLISGITLSDVDAGTNPVVVTVKVNSGTLNVAAQSNVTIATNNTGTVTLTGTIANLNTALTNLRYTSSNNFSGNDSLNITVNDQGNTGGDAKSDSKAIALTVNRDLGPLSATPNLKSGTVNATDPVDFYQFTLTRAGNLSLNLTNLNTAGDTDLAILDSSGNVIASSNNPGFRPESIRQALTAGTYRIRIRILTGATQYLLTSLLF
jgi:hypothetical protein